ncbi:MAG: B3/B4 domain-containing protein [Vicinamibacterales bacterium]
MSNHSRFVLATELSSIVRPGVIWWSGALVVDREPRLDHVLAEAESRARVSPPPESAAVRTMYKRVGLDPTKTRPSNEALLRRIRKGDGLPRINSIVDVINWCSLEFQLPYGLYDASQIVGSVTMRLGRENEEYPGIRKETVHVAGRITVADENGPFGNPTSDSARTMVTSSTTDALVVVYAPSEVIAPQLEGVLETTARRIAMICGGREVSRSIAS